MSSSNIPNAISIEYLNTAVETDKKKLPICKRLKYAMTIISVEPLVLLHMLAMMMSLMACQNLALEKACRVNIHFNDSICDALVARDKNGYDSYHETQVQHMVTKWSSYKSMVMGSVPVILMMFLGSWSDRHSKRKPIILLPMIGDTIANIGLLICSIYLLELPIQFSWFAETIFPAIFGGMGCLLMGIFSYVSSISKVEDRTIRIGTATMCFTIAISLGMFLSGVLLNRIGFIGTFSCTISMMVTALLYGICQLKETNLDQKTVKPTKKKGFLQDFFALEHIKNTFTMCFKEGPGNRKKKMIIIMVLAMITMGPLQGELLVLYMYIRLKFGWNEVDYSIYYSVHFVIQIFGNSFSLSVFSKYLKMDDAMLGVIASISKCVACLMYAFAPSGLYFYIGAILEVFHGTSHIALRAFMGKIVAPHELGQSNSVFGICEAMMPLIFGPLYTTIYIKTMSIFPGTFFIVSAILFCITFSFYMWLYIDGKKERRIRLEKEETIDVDKTLLQNKFLTDIKQSLDVVKA